MSLLVWRIEVMMCCLCIYSLTNLIDLLCSRLNFTMNKGGAGGGTSGAGGPTAAAAAAAAQKQKSLQQRVDNDIGSIVDNFSIVVNVARVNFYFLSCFLQERIVINKVLGMM